MLQPHFPSLVVALATLLTASPLASVAAPTPEPGGAVQVAGVAGTLKSTLFNGHVRVRKMMLDKPSGAADESYTDNPQTKWLAFRSLMSNGTSKTLDMQQFSASLVDADGVAVPAQPDKLRPMGSINGIPPGGAWHEIVFFNVPVAFVPVKIVLVPVAPPAKAFRIDLTAADLPK